MPRGIKIILDIAVQFFIVTGFLYAAYQLFVVFGNKEGSMVLFNSAASIPHELLVARRLYALEFWLIFTCYIVYLGFRQRLWNFEKNG